MSDTDSDTDIAAQETRLLFDNVIDYAILVLDNQGNFTDWNAGAECILGYTKEEALGKHTSLIFTPENMAKGEDEKELRTALAQGKAEDERWNRRKNGSRFFASGVMTALFDSHGKHGGFAKILRDLTQRKQMEDDLHRAKEELEARVIERTAQLNTRTKELSTVNEERRELLRQIVTAQEIERGRVARELHDDMGQNVTALLLGLNNLSRLPDLKPSPHAQEEIQRLYSLGQEVAEQVHRISFRLRPTTLDDLGIVAALKNQVGSWKEWNGIPAEMEVIGANASANALDASFRFPLEIETTIYRVVQEALTNVTRHAKGATRVDILLQRTETEVRVTIEDDGQGFSLEEAQARPAGKRRMGLVGMRERAELVGGTLDIESEPEEGTTVFLRIPLPEPHHAPSSK